MLEPAIRQRWASSQALVGDVPLARLFVGAARGPVELPYVVLTQRSSAIVQRTSSGAVLSRVALRFTLWAAELDVARRIAAAVDAEFDRTDLLAGELAVLNLQRLSNEETLEPDGTWKAERDFEALIEQRP